MEINQILTILQQQPYFTKQNLGLALGKQSDDLNYWLKKLIREKLLLALKKGFYISPYYSDQSEDYWLYLANVLRLPSYVSLEYVLAKEGLIPEAIFGITSITLKSSRRYLAKPMTFIYRNIKRELFYGYEMTAFGKIGLTVRLASPAKALFDFLYLKKFESVKNLKAYLLKEGRINWQVLKQTDKINFAKIIQTSNSRKMAMVRQILIKEKIL